jgi:hypothetical protein
VAAALEDTPDTLASFAAAVIEVFDVVAEADVVPLAVVVPLADVEVQTTAVGRLVTPEILQKPCANAVAFFWSSTLQSEARQHAMPLRKLGSSQMHLALKELQPPIASPEVNLVVQARCIGRLRLAWYDLN